MSGEDQKTILLVDDEAIIAMTVKMTLEKYGYKVIIANTGEEAVAAVAKTSGIDLILMDINLGAGIDGPEAAAIILRQRDLPVVFLSSHTEPEVVEKTEKITSYGYVVKNSSITVLDASIKMAFKLFEAKIGEKKKEEALRESEERYRSILNASPDGIAITDIEGRLLMVSPAVLTIFGYERVEKLLVHLFSDFIVPEDHERAAANVALMFQGTMTGPGEYRGLRADGDTIDIEVNGGFVQSPEGRPEKMVFIIRDITERKRTEQELRKSEERLQLILATLPVAIFTSPLDPSIDVSWVSGDVEKVTGFTVAEYMAENDFWRNRLHADDRERVLAAYGNPAAGDEIVLEYRWLCKDGNYKWFYDRVIKKQTPQGIQYFGIISDINERKQAESHREAALEALRQSEAKQSNALQMTKSGHWEYDVDTDLFTFNDNFYRIFRTTAAAVGGYQMSSADYARRFCHPDDMAMVGSETQGAIASTDPDYNRQIEHRILYADGTVGYIAVRFFIVKDPQGRTVKAYGVNQDITERKRAEEEIKRQLAEKEILLREVHHRIKNNIASIGGLLALHRQAVTHPQAVAALQDAISRVGSMEVLYEKLLLTESYKDISVKKYIGSLADTIIALFPGGAKVAVDKQVADFHLDAKRLFPLGLIVNELITNKMKYAFIKRKTGRITISLAHADGHVTLSVLDNGKELPVGFDIDKSKGFGLTLVKMLCQQLGGSFAMEKRKGTRCTVEFDV